MATVATTGTPAAALASSRVGGLRTRPNRPLRALAGALLVVTAVVVALAVYTRLGDRVEVLAVGRTVLAGEQITAADLRVVSIAAEGDVFALEASERASVVGQYARVRIATGALLVADSLQSEPVATPNRVLMSVELPAGQVPVGLREHSRVLLFISPRAAGASSSATAPLPSVIEANVAAVPRDLAEIVGGAGSGAAMVALSVEVPAADVAAIGAAESIGIGVLDPSAAVPAGADTTISDVAATEVPA